MKRFIFFENNHFLKRLKNSFAYFFKSNFFPLCTCGFCSLFSTVLISLGVRNSTKSLLDQASIVCSSIAKDNEFNKVHISTKLRFYSDSDAKTNSTNNISVFTKSSEFARDAFLTYSSAAFQTRNNFYNIPIEPNKDGFEYKEFIFQFAKSNIALKNITAPTYSTGEKQYTTAKLVDGEVDNNYLMTKLHMETLDIYLMYKNSTVTGATPLFLPDYIADKIIAENDDINSYEDCLGRRGEVYIDGVKNQVYIRNIIVTRKIESNIYDLTQNSFTENNVRFSKFLKLMYDDYCIMFNSTIYAGNQCLLCGDFDSEFFKTRDYIKGQFADLNEQIVQPNVWNFKNDNGQVKFCENQLGTNFMERFRSGMVNKNRPSFFDGDLWLIIIGIAISIMGGFSAIVFFIKQNNKTLYRGPLNILLSIFPFLIIGLMVSVITFLAPFNYAILSYVVSNSSLSLFIPLTITTLSTLPFCFKGEKHVE